MPPALPVPRKECLERDLLYLFSYDANLELRRDDIGYVPGGTRVNFEAKPDLTRVYHVARERSTLGFRTIQGTVTWAMDRPLLRTDDVGLIDVRLTLRTDDGAIISCAYDGVFDTGPRGYRRLIGKDSEIGTDEAPVRVPVYITPRYACNAQKYAWLMQFQCVGFGEVTIIDSVITHVTFDIYAMD